MSLIAHLRRLSRWPRYAHVLLVVAFAISVVMHAGHSHDQNQARSHIACGYCATFGGLADVPAHKPFVLGIQRSTILVLSDPAGLPCIPVETVAQPRAPPAFC